MAEPATQFVDLPPYDDGTTLGPPRRIAFIDRPAAKECALPAVVWLTGLKSSMISTKAAALDAWCAAHGRRFLRLDYSGHGQSSGRFEDGRVGAWIEEARAVIDACLLNPQRRVIVASSMGAHVGLKLLLDRTLTWRDAVAKLVVIAPAWNATERLMWDRFSPDMRERVLRDGVYYRPSRYGDGAYPLTRGLIEDGRRHLISAGPLSLPCPLHILHGAADPDVPLAHGHELAQRFAPAAVRFEIVPDGDHRLSRPEDIARLLAALDQVA